LGRRECLAEPHATLEPISRWLDVLQAQIDLRLPAVVRGVSEGPPEHFERGGLPSSCNINHSVQLRGRGGGEVFGALVEGIGKKLDGSVFIGAGGCSQRFGSRRAREGIRVGICDVDHA